MKDKVMETICEKSTTVENKKVINAYAIPGIVDKDDPNNIIEAIMYQTGHAITKRTRKREIVEARQIAMVVLKQKTRLSLDEIGIVCGNYDHATVLHASRTVPNLMCTDKEYRLKYTKLLDMFGIAFENGNLKLKTISHD